MRILSFYNNIFHIYKHRVCCHIHSFAFTRNICFHYRITFMNEIIFSKGILVRIRIRVHYKIHIRCSTISRSPQKIFAFFIVSQFYRHPDITIKNTSYLSGNHIAMFLFQQSYLTIHLSFHKEIYNHFTVLCYKFLKFVFIRSLNCHNHLRRRINITGKLEFGLSINILNIHNDDITEYFQHTVKMLRVHI